MCAEIKSLFLSLPSAISHRALCWHVSQIARVVWYEVAQWLRR